ncbi:hypothetical protein D3C87_1928570 [compost metagenome]
MSFSTSIALTAFAFICSASAAVLIAVADVAGMALAIFDKDCAIVLAKIELPAPAVKYAIAPVTPTEEINSQPNFTLTASGSAS